MARCAQHPSTMSITSTLLEFLYLMVEEYAPSMRDQIRNHIKQAHSELLDVKVIRTVGEYKVEDDRIQNYTEYLFSGSMLKPIRSLVMENAQTDYEASVRMSINSDFQGSIESCKIFQYLG